MPGAMYFVQECPVCGRRLQIRVMDLGKQVTCRHCRGVFEAIGAAAPSPAEAVPSILERVDELLASVEARRQRPR